MGETQAVTAYVRGIGDDVTRLDRMEPDLNVFVPGDLRDTTSPAAMISTWEAMLLGSALTPESHAQLAAWMRLGGVTGGLIRASVPPDWTVADKSGGGQYYTRNLVAMITPPNRAPWFVAIYVSDTAANWTTRDSAITEIGAAIIEVLRNRQVDLDTAKR